MNKLNMKATNLKNLLVLLVFLVSTQSLLAQKNKKEKTPAVNGWEWREDTLTNKEARKNRKEFLQEMADDNAKHFPMPQGKWYFGFNGGFGTPLLTVNRRNVESYLGNSDYFENALGEQSNRTVVTNDGGGFKASIYGGYRFNQFIRMEAELYFSRSLSSLQGRVVSPLYNSELTTKNKYIALNPQIVLNTPQLGRWSIFGKFGVYLPIVGNGTGKVTIDDRNGTFLKSIAQGSDKSLINLIDVLATTIGESVEELQFLEDGVFQALGYRYQFEADANVDLRLDRRSIGFSGAVGVNYELSKLITLTAEARIGGFSATTKAYSLENIQGSLDISGNKDFVVFSDDGAVVEGGRDIPAQQLTWLYNVDYSYDLDENSNNPDLNPDGFNNTQPTDRLGLRRSVYDASINIGIQFNFQRNKSKNKNN